MRKGKGTCKIVGKQTKDQHFMENEINLKDYVTKNKTLHMLIFGNKNDYAEK